MGNCCGPNTNNHSAVVVYNDEKYMVPRIVVIPEDCAIIYLYNSATYASTRLEKSLKRKFPNLVSCNGEKRLFIQTEIIRARKYYVIVAGNIQEETLQSMLTSPKIKKIYFCLEQNNLAHYSKSSKIKGFFQNQMELKHAIYYDIRYD